MENELTIGHVAKLSGVPVDTIRFYERKGLIQEPPRNPSGYRVYHAEAIEQIRFIRESRDLRFSLDEIGKLMSLLFTKDKNCSGIQQLLETKIEYIHTEIEKLVAASERLKQLRDDCSCPEVSINCPMTDFSESKK